LIDRQILDNESAIDACRAPIRDENVPFPVVQLLRHFGHDVVTLAELGKAGQAITPGWPSR
jgi:hypothetical protein